MSWADSPPACESVDMPDVPAFERPDELDRECDLYEYGADSLGGESADLHIASPFAGNRTDPAGAACGVAGLTTERIDYDHMAALAGSLR